MRSVTINNYSKKYSGHYQNRSGQDFYSPTQLINDHKKAPGFISRSCID